MIKRTSLVVYEFKGLYAIGTVVRIHLDGRERRFDVKIEFPTQSKGLILKKVRSGMVTLIVSETDPLADFNLLAHLPEIIGMFARKITTLENKISITH